MTSADQSNDSALTPSQLDLGLIPIGARRARPSLAPEGQTHRIAALFAGIGGIELGMHRAGHSTRLFCENDPSALAVLRARFEDSSGHGPHFHEDVVSLAELPRETTLVTAGFPCQDLSQAGATKGIAGARSGLVGEVFRLIRNQNVPWILLENVPFMLQLARGEAMNVIATAFEELGYRWAYRVVDSRAFGLPQRRRRVYLVASNYGDPRTILFADEAGAPAEPEVNGQPVACGFYWTEGLRGLGWAVDAVPTLKGGSSIGIPSPPAILMPDRTVVTPDIVDAERLQGFPQNWTRPATGVSRGSTRWKLVGNAVSVRAAAWIGRRMRRPGLPAQFETSPQRDHRRWPTAAWNVGNGREHVVASEWPVRRHYVSLAPMLTERKLRSLSEKATSGFLSRAANAKLRFPGGFIQALTEHRARMVSAGSSKLRKNATKKKASRRAQN